jgi:hypothetical protein
MGGETRAGEEKGKVDVRPTCTTECQRGLDRNRHGHVGRLDSSVCPG